MNDSTPPPIVPRSPLATSGTLYIFLHGLMAIDDDGKVLRIFIPNVGTTHSYRYGEYLGEITLQPSSAPYHITGLDPTPPFDPNDSSTKTKFTSEAHLV